MASWLPFSARSICAHLRPGGIAQLLGNWDLAAGEDWREHVQAWLPTALDGWIIQRDEQDVSDYAMIWARDAGHAPGTPEFERWYAAWLDDFVARGVERVGFGGSLAKPERSP